MQWVDIGFQGKDPATDFRGAGMLGLEQLLAITDHGSEYREEALKMYQASIDKKNWYFFAVTGLNITEKIQGLFDSGAFDDTILQNLHDFEEWRDKINDAKKGEKATLSIEKNESATEA